MQSYFMVNTRSTVPELDRSYITELLPLPIMQYYVNRIWSVVTILIPTFKCCATALQAAYRKPQKKTDHAF